MVHAEPREWQVYRRDNNIDFVNPYSNGRALITMRDPILQFLSIITTNNFQRNAADLLYCVRSWQMLDKWATTPGFDVEFLRIDGDLEAEQTRIATWAGVPYDTPFDPGPIGNQRKEPLGYADWAQIANATAETQLLPFRLQYGYPQVIPSA